jgi:hypothetical protein
VNRRPEKVVPEPLSTCTELDFVCPKMFRVERQAHADHRIIPLMLQHSASAAAFASSSEAMYAVVCVSVANGRN